ncbi:cytochrome c oxidase assembly protein [Yoonia sp.]|uniref:cytochrome c oxidase assembly protein n=1 Tax=Yoonia sp. TaxID=2212373 RepID=UPI002FD90D02
MKLFPNLQGKYRTLVQTISVVVLMGGLAWASVPFYDWFCRVTGFGGATSVADGTNDVILDQTIKVRFDASLERNMPWTFKPEVREVEIRIGETGLAFYEAHNPLDVPIAGQASYNVTPYQAGRFFDKVECFCFTEQVLMPGETVMMPVSFLVHPDIVDDREGRHIHTITLSYTFYQIDLPEDAVQQASVDAEALTIEPSVGIETN